MEIPIRDGSSFYGDRGGSVIGNGKAKNRAYRSFPLRITGAQDEEDCQVIARQAAIKLLHLRDTNSQDLRKLVMLRGLLQTTSVMQDYHQATGIKFRKRRSKIPTRLVKNLVTKPCKDVKAWWNHHDTELESRPNGGETCDSHLRRQRGSRREGEPQIEVIPQWRDIYRDIENRTGGPAERLYDEEVCEEDRPKESPSRRGICIPVRHPPRRQEVEDSRSEGTFLNFKEVTPNTYVAQLPTKKGKCRSAGNSPRKEEPLSPRPATSVVKRPQEDKKKEDRSNFLKKGKSPDTRIHSNGKKKTSKVDSARQKLNNRKEKQDEGGSGAIFHSPSKVKISLVDVQEEASQTDLDEGSSQSLESDSSQLLLEISQKSDDEPSQEDEFLPVKDAFETSDPAIISSIQTDIEPTDEPHEEESFYSVLDDSIPSIEELENGEEDSPSLLTPSLTKLLTGPEILSPDTDDKFPDVVFHHPEQSEDYLIPESIHLNNSCPESETQIPGEVQDEAINNI